MTTRPRTDPKEITRTKVMIDGITRDLQLITEHLTDLHSIAYDKIIGQQLDHVRGGDTGSRPPAGYTTNQNTKRLVSQIGEQARRTHTEWSSLASQLRDILGGESPEALRGTLIPSDEYRQALQAQSRRLTRANNPTTAHLAEYQPQRARGQTQPGYPHTPTPTTPKATNSTPKRKGWHR